MRITLTVDDEIVRKVHNIAADKNTTLTAMVREYLSSVANTQTPALDAAARPEEVERLRQLVSALADGDAGRGTEAGRKSADKFLETVRQLSRPMGPRNWTRDDLYDRPYAYRKPE